MGNDNMDKGGGGWKEPKKTKRIETERETKTSAACLNNHTSEDPQPREKHTTVIYSRHQSGLFHIVSTKQCNRSITSLLSAQVHGTSTESV